jgi:hypothetical protein
MFRNLSILFIATVLIVSVISIPVFAQEEGAPPADSPPPESESPPPESEPAPPPPEPQQDDFNNPPPEEFKDDFNDFPPPNDEFNDDFNNPPPGDFNDFPPPNDEFNDDFNNPPPGDFQQDDFNNPPPGDFNDFPPPNDEFNDDFNNQQPGEFKDDFNDFPPGEGFNDDFRQEGDFPPSEDFGRGDFASSSQRGPPPGCFEERTPEGFVKLICEGNRFSCPRVPSDAEAKCSQNGGSAKFSTDHKGCSVFNCNFNGQRELQGGVFKKFNQCPGPDEVDQTFNKCASAGLQGVVVFENGCNIAKCIDDERHAGQNQCPPISKQNKDSALQRCNAQGLKPVRDFDQNGCNVIRCESSNSCRQHIEDGAYQACETKGGEMIVNRNPNGCIAFAECVQAGNTNNVFVERSNKVLDSGEILELAFKLEALAVELDKLAIKSDNIADYYSSTGSNQENRFRRVSDMFHSAEDDVQRIKDKIRSRLSDLNKDDMFEIRHDIKYLKDVVIKDIVYVMLSDSDEVESIVSGSETDCGTDEQCFDRAFRLCKPITFLPEGREGPLVKVAGLEGDACIMEVQEQFNPELRMTCKIKKYSLGVRDPETDVLPFCEGPLFDEFQKHGFEGGPGVEGLCSGDECREICPASAENARRCLDEMGDFLPPEAKFGLKEIAEGRAGFGRGPPPRDLRRDDNFRNPVQDFRRGDQFGPGEFREDFEPRFNDDFRRDQGFGPGDDFSQRPNQFPPPNDFNNPPQDNFDTFTEPPPVDNSGTSASTDTSTGTTGGDGSGSSGGGGSESSASTGTGGSSTSGEGADGSDTSTTTEPSGGSEGDTV